MKIEIEIEKITIVRDFGTDSIAFKTGLPMGVWPFDDSGAFLKMEVARNQAEKYLKDNFPELSYKVNNTVGG